MDSTATTRPEKFGVGHGHDGNIEAEIHNGTVRDAVLYAVGENTSNGIRRTNADKRASVMMLLKDEEWFGRLDRWIAEKCAVSNVHVSSIRKEVLNFNTSTAPKKTTGRDGKSCPATKPRSNSSPSSSPTPKSSKPSFNAREFIDRHTKEPDAKTAIGRVRKVTKRIEEIVNSPAAAVSFCELREQVDRLVHFVSELKD